MREPSDSSWLGRQRDVFFLCALLVWCIGLLVFRANWTGSNHLLFLIWNLFLAGIPLLASRLLRESSNHGNSRLMLVTLLAVWLLFLPNAPYILTDIVHLPPRDSELYWFDLAIILSCAGTGLLLGYISLFDVQRVIESRFGSALGWGTVISAMVLSGYGVYLGRVMRWNSWDVITNPKGLFSCIVDCLLNPSLHIKTYVVSGLFGAGLILGYTTLHSIISKRSSHAVAM